MVSMSATNPELAMARIAAEVVEVAFWFWLEVVRSEGDDSSFGVPTRERRGARPRQEVDRSSDDWMQTTA